jgi:hypothetical protein
VGKVRPIVRSQFDQARREYVVTCAPYGLSDEAFLAWLEEQQAVVKMA